MPESVHLARWDCNTSISRRGFVAMCGAASAVLLAGCSSAQSGSGLDSGAFSSPAGAWEKVRDISYRSGDLYVTEYTNDGFGHSLHKAEYKLNSLTSSDKDLLFSFDNDEGWLDSLDADLQNTVDFEYDSDGRTTFQVTESYEHSRQSGRTESAFLYDERGNMIERTDTSTSSEGASKTYISTFDYDYYNDGSWDIRSVEEVSAGTREQYESYDEKGHLIRKESYSEDGSLYYQLACEYDDNGNQTCQYCTGESGRIQGPMSSFENDYDENGRLISSRSLGAQNTLWAHTYHDGSYLHLEIVQRQGWTNGYEYIVYDPAGNQLMSWDSEAQEANVAGFDSEGRLIDARYIDEASTVTQRQCSFYDSYGNKLATASFNETGFSVFTAMFVNSATHARSVGDTLFDFIESNKAAGTSSYGSLEEFASDPSSECQGVWCSGRLVMAFMSDGAVEAVWPQLDGSSSIESGTWTESGDKIEITFASRASIYSLECDSQGNANLVVNMSAEKVYRVSNELVKA